MSDHPDLASACRSAAARLVAVLAGVPFDPGDDPAPALTELRRAAPVTSDRDPLARRRWIRLRERYHLSGFELDLLALAALPSAHGVFGPLFARLHPRRLPVLSPGLAARTLLDGVAERTHLDAALLDGPLVGAGLLRADDAPYAQRGYTPAPGLWETLYGFGAAPPGGAAPPARPPQPGTDLARAGALLDRDDATILVLSDDRAEATAAAEALIRSSGRTPYPVREPGPATALLCGIRGDVPVIAAEAGPDDLGWLDALRGPAVVVAPVAVAVDAGARVLFAVRLEPAGPAERRAMWHALLPGDPAAARELAALHRVGPVLAARAHADAAAAAAVGGGRAPSRAEISRSLRRRATVALPAAARLVRPNGDWSGVVLLDEQRALLAAAVGRIREQARVLHDWGLAGGRRGVAGVRLLFAGPPGTGKTLAAELLAAELGLDLLVVDLAAVVSRWLGETEKNIGRVFDAADSAQSVLFFDEADALFARRTEVGDAHDRWANLETAYLLDRLERFEGVAILATNLRANIDEAFVRRLEFVVEFAEPERPQRERIWRTHLPATLPVAPDVELAEFARLYPMTGALIRNAAVAAAFLAACDGGCVTRDHLVLAVRREYDKAGRSFPGVPRRRTSMD